MSETVTDRDLQLLTRYAQGRGKVAFTEIVRHHLDLVHFAALRQVRSPKLAEAVSPSVFTDLARTAWLYKVMAALNLFLALRVMVFFVAAVFAAPCPI